MTRRVESFFNGLMPYLESLPGSRDVKLKKHVGLTHSSIQLWEDQKDVTLPLDLIQFLTVTNGVSLSWSSSYSSKVVGEIIINPLDEMNVARVDEYNLICIHDNAPFGRVLLHLDTSRVSLHTSDYKLHKIANSFSDYVRLLISTLGIRGWQMAYTEEGWHSECINMMYFYAPEVANLILRGKAGNILPRSISESKSNRFDMEAVKKYILK